LRTAACGAFSFEQSVSPAISGGFVSHSWAVDRAVRDVVLEEGAAIARRQV
jgi:hypothetical protein